MSITINGKDYDHLTYEVRGNKLVVHGWGTYEPSSVLAGQPQKNFIESFEMGEEDELKKQFPTAVASHPDLQPQVSLDHLPYGPDDLTGLCWDDIED